MEYQLPFIIGKGPAPEIPLSRYLPPVPTGMISGIINRMELGGKWILDPMGSSPLLALEAAAAGCRVLVASSNPILQFILGLMADAPSQDDFNSALAVLANSRLGNERFEKQIKSVYETVCTNCLEKGSIHAYLWKRGEKSSYAQLVECPQCKTQLEILTNKSQDQGFGILGNPFLVHARAIEHVHPDNLAQRETIIEFLELYENRPLSILFSLINRIEGLEISHEQKKLLNGLLINLCDDAASTWIWPTSRTRPRTLAVPPQFKENNLWDSLEESISTWVTWQQKIPLTIWPNIPPPSGGICIYPGKLRNLPDLPEEIHIEQVLSIVPYPNQAFWISSAIWAGWLWGKDQSEGLRSSLERKRVDAHWMYLALKKTFRTLYTFKAPLFLIIPEATSSLCSASILAASESNFSLDGMCLEPDTPMAQIQFSFSDKKYNGSFQDLHIARSSIRKFLEKINEPAVYLQISSVSLEGMANRTAPSQSPDVDLFNNLQTMYKGIFDDRNFIQPYGSPAVDSQSPWNLIQNRSPNLSLSDQIEIEMVNYLQINSKIDVHNLLGFLFKKFPGIHTPHFNFLEACLKSYTEEDFQSTGGIHLHANDISKARIEEITHCKQQLKYLAKNFGLSSMGENPILWFFSENAPLYEFNLISSSNIAHLVLKSNKGSLRKLIIILPAARMELLEYKLKNDPSLAVSSSEWIFLNYPSITQITENHDTTLDEFNQMIASKQSGFEQTTQLSFF